jgi:sugar lactone lactonase YvrE
MPDQEFPGEIMKMSFIRPAACLATACLALGMAAGVTALQLGCASNPSGYQHPAPAISAFTAGTMNGTAFQPALPLPPIPQGGSAWFRANFSSTVGGSAFVTPGNIPVTSNVPFQISNIQASTTYTLTLTGGDGQKAVATVDVTVHLPPSNLTYTHDDATCYVDVQTAPNSPTLSGSAPFSFSVDPALPAGLSIDANTGAITGTPQAISGKAIYTVTAKNDAGSTTHPINITVADTPITYTLSTAAISLGDSATLAWDATQVAGLFSSVSLSASPADASLGSGPFGLSGTKNVSPATTTVYTLTATPSAGGAPVTRTLGLTVGTAPVSITAFTANPSLMKFGEGAATLSWAYTGIADTLTLNGSSVLGSTSVTVTPARRETFTLFGSNSLGNDTKAVDVAVRGLDLVAGEPGGSGTMDGKGTWASLNNPQSIAADASGNLYLAEINNNMFREITPDGTVITLAGSSALAAGNSNGTAGNPLTATFKSPRGIFPDAQGYVWLCDSGNGLLRVITPAKTVQTVTGFGGSSNSPNQIVIVSNDGTTAVGYVADYKAGLVKVVITLSTMTASSTPIAGFSGPSGICADANGIVYVADTGNKVIKAVKNDVAIPLTGHGLTFEQPYGVAALTDGSTTYVFVADPGAATPISANQIYRFAVDTSSTSLAASAGISMAGSTKLGATDGAGDTATFGGPQGIVVVGTDAYVVDSKNKVSTIPAFLPATGTTPLYNNAIRKLANVKSATSSSQVVVSTFAGNSRLAAEGKVPTSGTCSLADARFTNPQGLAVDKNGDIYLADTGNNRIVHITAAGVVSNFPNDSATFTTPTRVAVDSNLNVYVLELGSTVDLKKIAPDQSITPLSLSAPLSSKATGIALDAAGTYLYVADGTLVKRVTLADGTVTPSTATFGALMGITLDPSSTIYVADGSVIKSIPDVSTAAASTVAGLSSSGFIDGTDTTKVKFNQPNSLAYIQDGGQGYLFVSDFYNSAIREVTLGTVSVTTLIGTPNAAGSTAGTYGAIPGRVNAEAATGFPGGGLYRPQAIAVTPKGDLVVTTNEMVMQLTAPLNK